jgi:hypothetical protein
VTYPETTCVVLGCLRGVQRSEHATYNRCPDHVLALLRGAFAAVPDAAPLTPDRLDSPSGARAVDGFPRAASGSRSRPAAVSVVSPVS